MFTFYLMNEIKDFIVTTTIEGHDNHQRRHVTGILTNENKIINNIDNVILTNGNYVMPLMEKLNIYIPVYPVKVFISIIVHLILLLEILGICC